MQFSNDIQVEIPLAQYNEEGFKESTDNMASLMLLTVSSSLESMRACA